MTYRQLLASSFKKLSFSILLSTLLIIEASALTFSPTETEWLIWPEYCRARYVVSAAGRGSAFKSRVPHSTVRQWEGSMGQAWNALHHFCASQLLLQRGVRTGDKLQRNSTLRRVIEEINYSKSRTPAEHFMVAEMAVTQSQAFRFLGMYDQANDLIRDTLLLHPEHDKLYTSLAIILRENKKISEALELLSNGVDKVNRKSSELHYVYGLLLFESKQYSESMQQAQIAYSLGYPLPGLKLKLKEVGYWKELASEKVTK